MNHIANKESVAHSTNQLLLPAGVGTGNLVKNPHHYPIVSSPPHPVLLPQGVGTLCLTGITRSKTKG